MPESNLQAIIAEAQQREREQPVAHRVHLYLPLSIMLLTPVVLWLTGSLETVAIAAVAAFFTVGKLIIVSGAAPDIWGMTAPQLAFMVFAMDMLVAYLFAYNLRYVYRIPRMGPWLERLQNYCRYWIVRNPWMRRWAMTGVALFVMFPLTGTGAPGGSILGRLVGLRPRTTLIAIAFGAALGCSVMAAFAAPLEPVFHDVQQEWWFKASGLVILGILLLFLIRLGRRLSQAAERYAQSQATGGEA